MTGQGSAADNGQLRFPDGKDPTALRTIGEMAEAFGIRQHVLRYWEQQFPMLAPLKRSGNRRLYRPEDVAMVAAIDRLVNREGYTLKGARQWLEAAGKPAPVAMVSAVQPAPEPLVQAAIATIPAHLLPGLRAVRDRLAQALAA